MRPVLLIAVSVLALTACGTTKTTTAVKRPTKAQYIAESDAICRAGRLERKPLLSEARANVLAARRGALSESAQAAEKEAASLLLRNTALIRAEDARLRKLPEPPGEGRTIEQLRKNASEGLANGDKVANALAKDELTAAGADVAAGRTAAASGERLARQYGFKVCDTPG
jgi:hypothetical protein